MAATEMEVAVTAFAPLLGLLEAVPDPRRAEGKIYPLPHVLLFSILAIVSGGNSYRSVVTFIEVHRRSLNRAFGLKWRRAPAHTSIRNILQGLDGGALEVAFRRHASLLQAACAKPACASPGGTKPGGARPGGTSLAIDGKTLRGSFDQFRDPTVRVHKQPDGRLAIFDGPRCLPRFDSNALPITQTIPEAA